MTDGDRAILREIVVLLRDIRRAVRPTRSTARDAEVLGPLVVAVAGRWGGDPFRVRDILRDKTFARLTGHATPTRLGAMMSRAAHDRRPLAGGLILESVGARENNARLWRIRRLPSG